MLIDCQLRFYNKMLHLYGARTEHVRSTLVKHSKNEILVMKNKAFLFSPLKYSRIFIFTVFYQRALYVLCTCSVRALYVLCTCSVEVPKITKIYKNVLAKRTGHRSPQLAHRQDALTKVMRHRSLHHRPDKDVWTKLTCHRSQQHKPDKYCFPISEGS